MNESEDSRLSTGIPELDLLLGGGVPRSQALLVRGGPGSGKTLLGLHYLAAARAARQKALLISFSDGEASIRRYAHRVGIDIAQVQCLDLTPSPGDLIRSDRYEIFAPPDVESGPVSRSIIEAIEKHRPERAFIDGFSMYRYLHADLYQYRRQLIALMGYLREQGCTALFSTEMSPRFSDEELTFAADGALTLHRSGGLYQVEVEKLRAGGFFAGRHRYTLDGSGWHVFPALDRCVEERAYVPQPVSTGFPALDALLGGGLMTGSTSLLCGVECSGKTVLAAALAEKLLTPLGRGALVLFDEPEILLGRRLKPLGVDLFALQADHRLQVEEVAADDSPEAVLHRIRVLAEARRCNFVVLDSLDTFLTLEGGAPAPKLWRQLMRYAAKRGLVLLATWRRVPGDGYPPAGLADTELDLIPASHNEAAGLAVRHHRFGPVSDRRLDWRMTATGVVVDDKAPPA